MWDCEREILSATTHRYTLGRDGAAVSCGDVLELWPSDEIFRSGFIATLAESSFAAYRWETPPITTASVKRSFEFVLMESPGLARAPDPGAFSEQFQKAGPDGDAIAFGNLSNDATLIVPRPAASPDAYVHLAEFVRRAPQSQVHGLWRLVGQTIRSQLSQTPLWLSTAGMGVAWLHVRIDRRPKYYGYRPYIQFS
jgi:hypothetical protein